VQIICSEYAETTDTWEESDGEPEEWEDELKTGKSKNKGSKNYHPQCVVRNSDA